MGQQFSRFSVIWLSALFVTVTLYWRRRKSILARPDINSPKRNQIASIKQVFDDKISNLEGQVSYLQLQIKTLQQQLTNTILHLNNNDENLKRNEQEIISIQKKIIEREQFQRLKTTATPDKKEKYIKKKNQSNESEDLEEPEANELAHNNYPPPYVGRRLSPAPRHVSNEEYDDEDDDGDDEEELWSPGDPHQFFTGSLKFEEGGACVGGIWLACDTRTRKQVAIKKIISEKTGQQYYLHQTAKAEISIFKHLQPHPNIVKFFEAFIVKKGFEYWIVMEYMDANTLFDIVTHQRYLTEIYPTEGQILRICSGMLSGLEFIHSKNVVHKDIKSENILFNEEGDIKIADFGNSCRLQKNGKAEEQEAVGTYHWMAPEILEEKEHDGKVDIWSFGIVLFEMLVGLPPHNDITDEIQLKELLCHQPISFPEREEKMWSYSMKQLFFQCVEKDPLKRPSASKLLQLEILNPRNLDASSIRELVKKMESSDTEELSEEYDE